MKKTHHIYLVLLLLCWLAAKAYEGGQAPPDRPAASGMSSTVKISDKRLRHILYGDRTGGGHLYGVNKPCKSEFPSAWGREKIVDAVKKVAANDNLKWKTQDNGYHVAEQQVEGTRIRIVLSRDRTEVITAYPTNAPRNPCPVPANDNQ